MPLMSFRDHIESGCSKERRMAHLCSSYLTFDSVSLAKRHCNKFYGSGLGHYLSVIQGGSDLTYGVRHQELLRSHPVVGMHRLVSVFIAIYILHIQAICPGQRRQSMHLTDISKKYSQLPVSPANRQVILLSYRILLL